MAAWSLAAGRHVRRATRAGAAAATAPRPVRAFFASHAATPYTQAHRLAQAFETLQSRAYALCLALLVLAILFLFWDLGNPERVLLILLRPHATVLTFGAIFLSVEAVLGLLLVGATALRLRVLQGAAKRILETLVCIFSIATMAYTGAFLMGSVGIAFWSSWTIVGLFLFSSLSCGLALALLAGYFIQDRALLLHAARPLQKWHLACLAGELLFVMLFAADTLGNPDAAGGIAILLSPDMLPTAVIGVLGFGIAIPAISEIYALARLDCHTIPVSDAICLAGGLILRFCIIACGVH